MNVLLFKQDLDLYSDSDILTIARWYGINADKKDLRWLIALRHANKKQMITGDPYTDAQMLKHVDIDELFEMCNINKYFKTLCTDELHRRYPKLKDKSLEEIYKLFNTDVDELFKMCKINKHFKTLCTDELYRRYPKLKGKPLKDISYLFKQLNDNERDTKFLYNAINSKVGKEELLDDNLYANDSLMDLDDQLGYLISSFEKLKDMIGIK